MHWTELFVNEQTAYRGLCAAVIYKALDDLDNAVKDYKKAVRTNDVSGRYSAAGQVRAISRFFHSENLYFSMLDMEGVVLWQKYIAKKYYINTIRTIERSFYEQSNTDRQTNG